ncbi:hypothetical protein C8F01DRAFT_942169, partial [Mycena amicta]
ETAHESLARHNAFISFLGTHTVPALPRVLSNAHKQGWSITTLQKQSELAAQGTYSARNYTDDDKDFATLMFELGGGQAVYALNHSAHAGPSRNTIQPGRLEHRIIPSVAGPSGFAAEAHANMATHYKQPQNAAGTLRYGHTIVMDATALEQKVEWLERTDQIGGPCTKHISAVETVIVGEDLTSIMELSKAVRDKKLHIAQEASVVAISRNSRSGYGAKPVLVIPSCKGGTYKQLLILMIIAVEAWYRDGYAEINGPLFSFASDGDGKQQMALFVLCMNSEVRPGNSLWPYLRDLPGLNLQVGK